MLKSISHPVCPSLLITFVLIAINSNAQNELPVISNLSFDISQNSKNITISYDISDADQNEIDVFLAIQDPKGNFKRIESKYLKGDIGFPVSVGKRKKIKLRDFNNVFSVAELENCKVHLIANDRFNYSIKNLVRQVDTVNIRQALLNIIGIRNYKVALGKENIQKTKDFISEEFKKYHLKTSKQNFEYLNHSPENIIGKIKGDLLPNKIFVLGAHFDTVEDSPGADDNGSGIVGMLEAMRILSQCSFEKTIEFVGFDLEEYGHLGSKEYVKQIKSKENIDIIGSINFDMIGYFSNQSNSQKFPEGFDQVFPQVYKKILQDSMRGNFAVLIANDLSVNLSNKFSSLSSEYIPSLKMASLHLEGNGESFPDLRRSDHASFWDSGYPSLYIGDGAYSRNPNYHSATDTLETINLEHIANVTKGSIAIIAEMAGMRPTVEVKRCLCDNQHQTSPGAQ